MVTNISASFLLSVVGPQKVILGLLLVLLAVIVHGHGSGAREASAGGEAPPGWVPYDSSRDNGECVCKTRRYGRRTFTICHVNHEYVGSKCP